MIDKDKMLALALQELELEEAQTHYPSQALVNGIAAVKAALMSQSEGEAKDAPIMEYPNYVQGVGWRNVNPLQRTWVGLTTQEIDDIIEDAVDPMDALLQTMDKLKEKNQ